MLGAIIGDKAGSNYEVEEVNYWIKHKEPRPYEERIKIMDSKTLLFADNSSYTDDTCWTCAIYDAIINGNKDYETYLKNYGKKELSKGPDCYGRSRFSKGSVKWIQGIFQGESFGNGGAMRISPIGFLGTTLEEVKKDAYLATIASHNHPDAIKAAESVAVGIFLLKEGMDKEEVENYIKSHYYSLDFNLEELRHNYTFTSKAKNSVPQALFCFFQSTDFENAIRTAISIGGDTDTIASITGALAEAYYKVPEKLKKHIQETLPKEDYDLLKSHYFNEKTYKKGE